MNPFCEGFIDILLFGLRVSITSVYLLSINACFKTSIFAESVYSTDFS